MPRIDPLQLLKCLSVLLSPQGGILSRDEVPRLVNLMTKFSKKLVSKCVYILILKNSDKLLLDLFMTDGGWQLIYKWLEDAVSIGNYNLVGEILTLLLITPVDVARLKTNNISKLVKNLSRREELGGVYELSVRLVDEWLKIAKGVSRTENVSSNNRVPTAGDEISVENVSQTVEELNDETSNISTVDNTQITTDTNAIENVPVINPVTFYKITDRDGKQVISKMTGTVEQYTENPIINEVLVVADGNVAAKKEDKSKIEDKNRSRSSHSSSSKSRSSSKSKSSSSSSKDKYKSGSSKSSSSSSKDRDRDRDRKDRDKYKDKHRSNGAKSSSSSNKDNDKVKDKGETKEKQAEKDKDTLAKIKPQSINKLGRIPKKSTTSGTPASDEKSSKEATAEDVKKKPTMSIEVRKTNTKVKVYQSKMRSTGLEEEVKPPPPRPIKKSSSSSTVLPSISLPVIPKRPSPSKDISIPPEKKLKIDIPAERPGSIKLIPPKPKPAVLLESDIFMDALTASASTKKETKRRKRRTSVSKDTPDSPTTPSDAAPITSPTLGLKHIAAPNFYQDTLDTQDDSSNKMNSDENEEKSTNETVNEDDRRTPTDVNNAADEEVPEVRGMNHPDGIKGILLDPKKKKAPKKSIRWKPDTDLVEIRMFDLDENERVNVSKTFLDMAKMEMSSEREAMMSFRKLPNEDMMEPQIPWRPFYLIDYIEPLDVSAGRNSKEKDIQYARELTVLKALYFDKRKIPDSPDEPMPENHQMVDPIIMPLEDADSQEMDLRNTPWPEPKGSPPPMQIECKMPPQIFQNMSMPFQMPPPNFQGMPGPRYNNQSGPGGIYPPNMLPNGGNMMGPPPPEMMHQNGLNPNMFMGGPGPDNFNMMNDGGNYPMPFNPSNNMSMYPPNNFGNMNRGGRGGFRRGGGLGNNTGPWIRMNGTGPNWNRGGGGPPGGHRGNGRLCKNIKNHGFCRNADNCPFVHPG